MIVFLLFLFVSTGSAQTTADRFTSVYTDLGTGCKILRGSGGTDDASICRGAGGYQIRVFSAAAATYIAAELKGSDETFTLATVNTDFDERKIRVEWRLANGKPFAVILRVPKYGEATADDPYLGKVIGQQLVIRGLKGFEIDASVDARDPNANARAREVADKAYAAARP